MRGDLQEGLVANDPVARDIGLLREYFARRRDFAQDGEKPWPRGAGLDPDPGATRVELVGVGGGQHRELLGHPIGAPGLAEALFELLIDHRQMLDIGERISQLPIGQRPLRPVGKARRLVDVGTGELTRQPIVRRRFAEAAHHRRDLGIEQRGRDRAAGDVVEDFQILTRRVQNLEHARQVEKLDHRLERDALGQRIDGGADAVGAGDLHQAELWPIGALAHEFGIDADERLFGEPGTQFGKCRGLGNQFHVYALNMPQLNSH